jgi:DNA-binding CsgD family transcriptional regulator
MRDPSGRAADPDGMLRTLPIGSGRGPSRAVNEHHLEALLARWKHGSDQAAAAELKISRHTLKNLLYSLRSQIGARDTTQATYLLRDALVRLDERKRAEGGSTP